MNATENKKEKKMNDREALQSIVDAYDFRSELFTSDEDCAGNLADRARKQLAVPAPSDDKDLPFSKQAWNALEKEWGALMDALECDDTESALKRIAELKAAPSERQPAPTLQTEKIVNGCTEAGLRGYVTYTSAGKVFSKDPADGDR
jgi:hypothetical protein